MADHYTIPSSFTVGQKALVLLEDNASEAEECFKPVGDHLFVAACIDAYTPFFLLVMLWDVAGADHLTPRSSSCCAPHIISFVLDLAVRCFVAVALVLAQ